MENMEPELSSSSQLSARNKKLLIVIIFFLLTSLFVNIFLILNKNQLTHKLTDLQSVYQNLNNDFYRLNNELELTKKMAEDNMQACTNIKDKLNQTETEKVNKDLGLVKYLDNEINLSFDYPKSWGEVEKFKWGGEEIDNVIELKFTGLSQVTAIFLAAINPNTKETSPNLHWYSTGLSIKSENDVVDFCDNTASLSPLNKKKNCSTFKTKNSILVAKSQNNSYFDSPPKLIPFYYLYSPYSSFCGVVISSAGFYPPEKANIDNLDEKLSKLVDSITFEK